MLQTQNTVRMQSVSLNVMLLIISVHVLRLHVFTSIVVSNVMAPIRLLPVLFTVSSPCPAILSHLGLHPGLEAVLLYKKGSQCRHFDTTLAKTKVPQDSELLQQLWDIGKTPVIIERMQCSY